MGSHRTTSSHAQDGHSAESVGGTFWTFFILGKGFNLQRSATKNPDSTLFPECVWGTPELACTLQQALEHSISGKMAAVIDFIKSEFNKTIAIQELTSICSMSASALHRHFKSVTGLSPIQYQKNLRLIHARQSLALNRSSVASVAFEVGYESPSQFSREYSRKFGFNPKQTPPMFAEVN